MKNLKEISKKLLILPLLLFMAITLSACTNDSDKDTDIDNSNDLEIIGEDDSNNPEESEISDDTSKETDVKEDNTATTAGNSDSTTGSTTTTTGGTSNPTTGTQQGSTTMNTTAKNITGASASDGVFGAGYSYETVGGELVYQFIVSGGPAANPYPSATAAYESNNLVVTFPSLTNDYAVTAESMILAGVDMTVQTTFSGGKSVYKFEVGSQKNFSFATGTNDEGKKVIFLKIDL